MLLPLRWAWEPSALACLVFLGCHGGALTTYDCISDTTWQRPLCPGAGTSTSTYVQLASLATAIPGNASILAQAQEQLAANFGSDSLYGSSAYGASSDYSLDYAGWRWP